jgi:hypothetical protein
MSKLQEKPSALKKEHPALQKMKFINSTRTACPIPLFNSLCLQQSCGSDSLNPDPDTDPIWIQGFDDQKNTDLIKKIAIATYLCPGYRRSLPTTKENIQQFKKRNLLTFFLWLWVIFTLLDQDPDPDTDPGTKLNPDPQHWRSMFYLAASTWCCCCWWKERYLAENSP